MQHFFLLFIFHFYNMPAKEMMRLLMPAVAFAVVGCASPPLQTEKALQVQLHRQTSNLLDKCTRLGPISVRAKGSTGTIHTPFQMATAAAELAAREMTRESGGDTLVLLQTDEVSFQPGFPPISTAQVQGIAFKCN